jgi:hypothetical protein
MVRWLETSNVCTPGDQDRCLGSGGEKLLHRSTVPNELEMHNDVTGKHLLRVKIGPLKPLRFAIVANKRARESL